MDKASFYNVLGVSLDAEPEVIEAAYRALRLKYHPDRVGADTAAQRRAQEIGEAYETLSHAEKRRRYDQEFARGGRNLAVPLEHPPRRTKPLQTSEASRELEAATIDTKLCPHCAEPIRKEAKVCRYCGLNVSVGHQEPPPVQPQTTIYNNINAHPQPTTTVTETYTVKPRENVTPRGCLLAAISGVFLLILLALIGSEDVPATQVGSSTQAQPVLATSDVCTAENERDGQYWGDDGRPWIIVGGECRLVENFQAAEVADQEKQDLLALTATAEPVSADEALENVRPSRNPDAAQVGTSQAAAPAPSTDDVVEEMRAKGFEVYSHDDPANPFVASEADPAQGADQE